MIFLKVPTILMLTSILKQPLNSGHLNLTDSFRTPNCTQTILNDPNLVDTRQLFQKDRKPLS